MLNQYRPPPIQYLPAFVAAAKHNSFKLAAEQLNVSPSAISQQIKTLEGHIGLPLFSRQKKQLCLTLAGEHFYQVAKTTLSHYDRGCSDFAQTYLSPTLKISMIPYVANELIIPRLGEFQDQYPQINLVVQTSMQLENLQETELDAAIRFGIPPWPDHDVALITKVESALVASEAYIAKNPINSVDDWKKQTLIHSRTQFNDWQDIMDRFNFRAKKELFFDSYDASLRAAREGLGIAMAVFVSDKRLTQGTLRTLSKKHLPVEEAFYLVTKPNEHKQAHYNILLQWLKDVFDQF